MYLDNTAIGKLQLQVNYSEPLTFSIQEGKYLRGIVYEIKYPTVLALCTFSFIIKHVKTHR